MNRIPFLIAQPMISAPDPLPRKLGVVGQCPAFHESPCLTIAAVGGCWYAI